MAAVAAKEGGLHLVDLRDPASPKLFYSCFQHADRVEVVNGVAYFVSGRLLRAVDMLSWETLPPLTLISPFPVLGMAREGTMLYLTDINDLWSIDVSGRTIKLRNQFVVGAPLGQPVVANGIAYLTLQETALGGYATVDVSNPDAPKVIRGTRVPPA